MVRTTARRDYNTDKVVHMARDVSQSDCQSLCESLDFTQTQQNVGENDSEVEDREERAFILWWDRAGKGFDYCGIASNNITYYSW